MKLKNVMSGTLTAITMACISYVAYAEVQEIKEETVQASYDEQHHCLALNLYHEARGDSKLGQIAVGYVTLNRVQSRKYPNTVCDVVYQAHVNSKGQPIRNKCQFSWYCDGKSDVPKNQAKFEEAMHNAEWVMKYYGIERDITDGAIMYHAYYSNPYWSLHYTRTSRIESHIFYK